MTIPQARRARALVPGDAHEVRRNEDGTVDEVVGFGFLHIEQMSAQHWWIGFDTADGRLLHLNVHARGGLRFGVEDQGSSDVVARRDEQASAQARHHDDCITCALNEQRVRVLEGVGISLARWSVWVKNGRSVIAHSADGDEPTLDEWNQIGAALRTLQQLNLTPPRAEEGKG